MTKKEKQNLERFPMSKTEKEAYFSTMTRAEAKYFIALLKEGRVDWDGKTYK